jgi:hypothetical protein
MPCWLLKSFLRNTEIVARYSSSVLDFLISIVLSPKTIYLFLLHHSSRAYFVTTVRGKGDLGFIGCTTNAAPAVPTIRELSKLIQQIVRHQASQEIFFCSSIFSLCTVLREEKNIMQDSCQIFIL